MSPSLLNTPVYGAVREDKEGVTDRGRRQTMEGLEDVNILYGAILN